MFSHLVAGDLKNNVGYIIPATQTFEDMKRKLGDDISTFETQLNMSAAPSAPEASPSEHGSDMSHSEMAGLGIDDLGIELRAIPAANFSSQGDEIQGLSGPTIEPYLGSLDIISDLHGALPSRVKESKGVLGWILWDNPMEIGTNPVRHLRSPSNISDLQQMKRNERKQIILHNMNKRRFD